MEVYLAALLPPANIQRIIGKVNESLFSQYGLLSSLALPVMMPLVFLSPNTTVSDFRLAFDGNEHGFRITNCAYAKVKNSLYIKVEPTDEGSRILNTIKNALSSKETTKRILFPVFNGFFLCQIEGKNESERKIKKGEEEDIVSLDNLIEFLGPVIKFGFTSFTYALIKIKAHDNRETRWQEVYWEILDEIKVKKTVP